MSVSPGAQGGFGANHHLRQSLVFLNMPVMQQPEAYIGKAAEIFDTQGNISNDSTRKFVTKFIEAYDKWISNFLEGDAQSETQSPKTKASTTASAKLQ